MTRGRKGFAEGLLDEGLRAVTRVAGKVMDDPRGQEVVARAVGMAQKGMKRFEQAQERALHLFGFAAKKDYSELAKQIARLKRKARELGERIEAQSRGGEEAGQGEAGGAGGDGSAAGAQATERGGGATGASEAGHDTSGGPAGGGRETKASR